MSTYKIIQVIGSSETSWEEAARTAVEEAGKHVRDLRIAEIETMDMRIENNKVIEFRVRVNISFRYEGSPA
jgi:flavin-binding protein dodecin